jgi:hypothetical protein
MDVKFSRGSYKQIVTKVLEDHGEGVVDGRAGNLEYI